MVSNIWTNRFNLGDKVISVKNVPMVPEGFIGYITGIHECGAYYSVESDIEAGYAVSLRDDELESLTSSFGKREDGFASIKIPNNYSYYGRPVEELTVTPNDINGIARPILEERKIGKIRMELFDTGFPLAILEIAKMMTWANQYKGYIDNDWKGIPDAENAFKGAAARHRVKLDAQRSFGEDLLNCVDEESGITHLAHECFNNLALLELALSGKIK